jgi:hypothetical protein
MFFSVTSYQCRPTRRWEDNIKTGLREVGWGGGAWTGSIWLRIGAGGGVL